MPPINTEDYQKDIHISVRFNATPSMRLVDYSDSESDEEPNQTNQTKFSQQTNTASLPPLPAAFRDLYSSTVRTSTQDDPSLHGGRKRVTPHIIGNWPTHVYLDWCPQPAEYRLLAQILTEVRRAHGTDGEANIDGLLDNELGVQLPLHVSLSRPLALKTEQKDRFLLALQGVVSSSGVHVFDVQPLDLVWHPNEDRTRWFLVLRLKRPDGDELRELLSVCNTLAREFDQPLLYDVKAEGISAGSEVAHHDSFHVSIASSLNVPRTGSKATIPIPEAIHDDTQQRLEAIRVSFSEVKIRIGQDVSTMSLQPRRVS